MKQHGYNEATDFSKKQIGVIYAAAKRGDLAVERWMMSRLYDLADFYGIDDNGSIAKEEAIVKNILEDVFAHDMESAQERINDYTDRTFALLSGKNQKSANRDIVA